MATVPATGKAVAARRFEVSPSAAMPLRAWIQLSALRRKAAGHTRAILRSTIGQTGDASRPADRQNDPRRQSSGLREPELL
jgi:hypothetical protein